MKQFNRLLHLLKTLPVLAGLLLIASCHSGKSTRNQSTGQQLAQLFTAHLEQDILEVWYPRCIDSVFGGFLTDFSYDWERIGNQNKMIVTQSRHIWTLSRAARFFPDQEEVFLAYAKQGLRFLSDQMRDPAEGGFYTLVTRQGSIVVPGRIEENLIKEAYGNAFALYAFSAYYRASGDTAARVMAVDLFHWLEDHSWDPDDQGYFQFIRPDGQPMTQGNQGVPPKDMNSSIHLLEALTEFYQVWPDSLVRDRLETMLHLVRDVITEPKGYMDLFFNRHWVPVSYRDSTREIREANQAFDHVSFGHDIEAAFLILEASEALELPTDQKTEEVAYNLVSHALKGWDKKNGGIYNSGYYFRGDDSLTIIDHRKVWWTQAEALNTLLLMSKKYPEDPLKFYDKFLKQWNYITTYIIDDEHGGWYEEGLDVSPQYAKRPKGHIWKGDYHNSRALMRCIRRLEQTF